LLVGKVPFEIPALGPRNFHLSRRLAHHFNFVKYPRLIIVFRFPLFVRGTVIETFRLDKRMVLVDTVIEVNEIVRLRSARLSRFGIEVELRAHRQTEKRARSWIPAFAGMTD
jgi:hypothetical protein